MILVLAMFGCYFVQAMHAHSSVAVGMKGATKAMAAMNKVAYSVLHSKYISCPFS
jgi:hypothetical protein